MAISSSTSQARWVPIEGGAPSELQLQAQSYDDFKKLCTDEVPETQFHPSSARYRIASSNVVDFVKPDNILLIIDKQDPRKISRKISASICIPEDKKSLPHIRKIIDLSYAIPASSQKDGEVLFENSLVQMATIELPHKDRHTVLVHIPSLENINKSLLSPLQFNQDTYSKLRDLAIYFVNQLTTDWPTSNSAHQIKLPQVKKPLYHSIASVISRLHKAAEAQDKMSAQTALL